MVGFGGLARGASLRGGVGAEGGKVDLGVPVDITDQESISLRRVACVVVSDTTEGVRMAMLGVC